MAAHFRVLAVLATTALLSVLVAAHTSAHEPHPGLQFSIAVDGLDGCDTRNGDATCFISPGETLPAERQS